MSFFKEVLDRYAERLTPRQWRLFACACVRRLEAATQGSSGAALDLAERFADGNATAHQLASARYSGRFQSGNAAWAVCWDPKEDSLTMAERASAWAAGLVGEGPHWDPPGVPFGGQAPSEGGQRNPELRWETTIVYYGAYRRDRTTESLLFDDIAGHLIVPAHLDPLWLSWNDGTVRQLAGSIYDERAWEQMPILGDALEDAGCQDRRILDHCRGGGPHTRSCWVVDLVLGMK